MVQVQSSVGVCCAQCGDSPGGPDSGSYYPSVDAALDAATGQGWVQGTGDRWWCSACGPVLTCELDGGHEFTPWHRAVLDETQTLVCGDNTSEGATGGYRWCRLCGLQEPHRPVGVVA